MANPRSPGRQMWPTPGPRSCNGPGPPVPGPAMGNRTDRGSCGFGSAPWQGRAPRSRLAIPIGWHAPMPNISMPKAESAYSSPRSQNNDSGSWRMLFNDMKIASERVSPRGPRSPACRGGRVGSVACWLKRVSPRGRLKKPRLSWRVGRQCRLPVLERESRPRGLPRASPGQRRASVRVSMVCRGVWGGSLPCGRSLPIALAAVLPGDAPHAQDFGGPGRVLPKPAVPGEVGNPGPRVGGGARPAVRAEAARP